MMKKEQFNSFLIIVFKYIWHKEEMILISNISNTSAVSETFSMSLLTRLSRASQQNASRRSPVAVKRVSSSGG